MSKFGTNPFVKLTDLLASPPPQVAQVATVHTDGTVTLTKRGGGRVKVRAAQTFVVGDQVILDGGTATGKAPAMTSTTVPI